MTAPDPPPGAAERPADIAAAPRPAASLVLLRDGPGGLQVLLLERPSDDAVLAGAHVFPGGKLDREDGDDDLLARIDASPDALHARLGEPELAPHEAAALYVAALREAFEETGVLIATGVDPALAERAARLRRDAALGFGELLAELDLQLQASALVPWSRWITPKAPAMMKRRFDTRFFAARLPEGQTPRPDPRETVGAVWLTPREALERYEARGIELAAPQIMTMVHLAHFPSVDAALGEAATRRPPAIRPESVQHDGDRWVCYPGDPAHPVPERAMPGPTRLRFAAGRFSPAAGEGWYD